MTKLEEKIKECKALIQALNKPRGEAGAREWVMSIPARRDDPDLIFADLIEEVEKMAASQPGEPLQPRCPKCGKQQLYFAPEKTPEGLAILKCWDCFSIWHVDNNNLQSLAQFFGPSALFGSAGQETLQEIMERVSEFEPEPEGRAESAAEARFGASWSDTGTTPLNAAPVVSASPAPSPQVATLKEAAKLVCSICRSGEDAVRTDSGGFVHCLNVHQGQALYNYCAAESILLRIEELKKLPAAQPVAANPPKVEEIAWQFIAHVFPSMDRDQAQKYIKQGAAILRSLFPVSQPPTFECGAQKANQGSSDYPQDCDWPFCGCDPKANKVLEAIEESKPPDELKRSGTVGQTPDFKTINRAIEYLSDAAEMLREKIGSTGFDASVALLIEWSLQMLKCVAPVSGNGTEPPELPEMPSHEDIKKVLGHGWKGFKLNDEDDLDFVIGQIRLAIMKCDALAKRKRREAGAASHNGQGWRRVEVKPTQEQIAAHNGWFQVANEHTKRQDVAKFLKGDFMGHALQFNDVTHWQPLAAPPSEADGPQQEKNDDV